MALSSHNARFYTGDLPEDLPFSRTAQSREGSQVWNLVTDCGRLDVSLVRSGKAGFRDLGRSAHDMTIMGIEIRVADLADVIRSKQAANRRQD